MRATASLVLLVAAAGACVASPGLIPPDPGLYDDLRSGGLDGALWDEGQYQIALEGGAAVLGHDIRSARSDFTHRTRLVALPLGGGSVTTFRADVTLSSASTSGDTAASAGIVLSFQPAANRIQRPADLDHALVLRVALQRSSAGLSATRVVLECPEGSPDCRAGQSVGTASGNFPPSVAVSTGTPGSSTAATTTSGAEGARLSGTGLGRISSAGVSTVEVSTTGGSGTATGDRRGGAFSE